MPELRIVVPIEGSPRLEFHGIDPDDRQEWLRLRAWLSNPGTAAMVRLLAELATPEWPPG